MSDIVTSEKLTHSVVPNLQRLRYSTESGSVSQIGEQRTEFKFGTDSIRTVDRIMVVSPPKATRKPGHVK